MQDITRDDLVALLEAGSIVLVEALSELHYNSGHIPTAVNLPEQPTAGTAAAIAPDPHATIVTYCSGPSCTRSKAAAVAFEKLGYADVRVYSGGKVDWFDAGLSLTATEPTAA